MRIELLAVALGVDVGDGECWCRNHVKPSTTQGDIERRAPFHNRAAHPHIGRCQSDAEIHMIAFSIAGLRGHIHHTRQTTAVARRKRRLVESHIANGCHIEGREQTAEVVHLIDGVSVDEKKVLVVVTTAHHHARQALKAGRDTGLHLQSLDQIDFAHDRRDAANLLGTQIIETHHGIVHFVLSTPHDQGAI